MATQTATQNQTTASIHLYLIPRSGGMEKLGKSISNITLTEAKSKAKESINLWEKTQESKDYKLMVLLFENYEDEDGTEIYSA